VSSHATWARLALLVLQVGSKRFYIFIKTSAYKISGPFEFMKVPKSETYKKGDFFLAELIKMKGIL
jgi:hypothetical protein